ncbi:MAG: DUF2061 domain-containing protein [Bacteroidales bacterium]|nr:DUF2061 domain-containing protein [Bacteroidales bacterium]RLD36075.1 MAG: hypothetical protein DRI74_09735 [Bacteroidota bacterium]
MKHSKKDKRLKESPLRSLLKAISWRIIASFTTFIITFVIFRSLTDKSMNETLQTAGAITGIDFFAKLIIYYLHERMWTNIDWGKSWKRKAWKRRYREAHKKLNTKTA